MRNIESLYCGSFARSEYVGLGTLHVYRKEIAPVGNRVVFGFSTQSSKWLLNVQRLLNENQGLK